MSYMVDLTKCAYVAGTAGATTLLLSHVTLFNNDPQGRVFAVHDLGRGPGTGNVGFLSVQHGQIGSGAVNALPVIPNLGAPPGQLTTGAQTADATTLMNGTSGGTVQWTHEFPLVLIPTGFRLTAWGLAVNTQVSCGFWYQFLDMVDVLGAEQPPKLILPKSITLTVTPE